MALILNSRQSKQPTGSDAWVVNTIAAANYAACEGFGLISSVGMNTYELVTYLASKLEVPLDLIVPSSMSGSPNELLESFDLNNSITRISAVESSGKSSKDWWLDRDRTAIGNADLVLPVSVNPEGNLAMMIAGHARCDAVTDHTFSTPYTKSSRRLYNPPDKSSIVISKHESWDYLTHWTRSFDGPWPNQKSFDYYDEMIASAGSYSHRALNSLKNILQTSKIFGTGERIQGGYEVVSLTERHPADAVTLMKWRARFVRWNFEPYGIAIERNFAESIGIRPVIYATPNIFQNMRDCDKPYFQNKGEKSGNWEPEQEWRFHGDIDLSELPADKAKIIVRKGSEINEVRELTSCEVVALTNEE
ncbi:MAG: hypothetical protein KKG33_03275 [candidate division Zixibacteria bacterium]|nr:hypothetical protein [candidate division Zixibacteria bacterium]MBU1469534.1 hypothetical protein [candidate division Zixibacteria bacterium]MBU2624564.1 hypothetical protein [candidate division Zixibacteria bacterium]